MPHSIVYQLRNGTQHLVIYETGDYLQPIPRIVIEDQFERIRTDVHDHVSRVYPLKDIPEYARTGFVFSPEEIELMEKVTGEIMKQTQKLVDDKNALNTEFTRLAEPLCRFIDAHPEFLAQMSKQDECERGYKSICDFVSELNGFVYPFK